MPKNTRKKGKQPLRPKRGTDGRWIPPSPDPDPPDDQGVDATEAHLADETNELPVTAGGLVIREPSPTPRTVSQLVIAPTAEAIVRSTDEHDEEAAQQPRSLSAVAAAPLPSPNGAQFTRKQAQVTVEPATDEEAGPTRLVSASARSAQHDPMREASPESEQQDSVLGNPVAQSTAHDALHVNTQFHTTSSANQSVNGSKSSRNTHSVQRAMREHAERAEARAQSAYEQNRAALDLISKSMDNVRTAFTEAQRARDRYHDILSVSSRSRLNARRHADANALSVHRAEREANDDVRKVADYRRRLRSQVLSQEERQEIQPSVVSSWRLRSGMYPASESRNAEGENLSMDLGTRVSTAKFTPLEAPHEPGIRRMGVRDWVGNQREIASHRSYAYEQAPTEPRATSPIARVDEVLARNSPKPTVPPAPKRTIGERVSWLDRLNRPSTSTPFARDAPPHRPTAPTFGMAGGVPGGSSSGSSSSSIQTARPQPTPRTPRGPAPPDTPIASARHVTKMPEYLRTNRSPTFEPVAPGGGATPSKTPNRGRAAAPAPALTPQYNTPRVSHGRPGSINLHLGGHNRLGRRDGTDKITNMLSVAFIDEVQAASRVDTVPLHKLGIKSSLPKPYEGQPDQTGFENWLSLLLGFFRIHQLDVLTEVQDRARLEILGQSLKDNAHTYFRERHQKLLEQGQAWDFREAVLDLRDRYLYKNTPFVAARKFETIMQGTRDAQALYEELSTQAARMIEYPSDYHFRLRFMLALRPEVLEYIIKTHSVSAEQSTLAQIRSACEDYERSNEYGKQLAATQSRLGGSKPSGAQQTSRTQQNPRGLSKAPRPLQRTQTSSYNHKSTNTTARPHGEAQSKTTPTRVTPKPDSKGNPATRHGQKPATANVSCFNCGGNHYAKNCDKPKARGYAARIEEIDENTPADDVSPDSHSGGTPSDIEENPSHEVIDDNPEGAIDNDGEHLEGDQYDPDDVQAYAFSSDDETEPVYSRATRIVATSSLSKIESRAVKASKPAPPKTPIVESNRARYKIGKGPQPQRSNALQRCIEVTAPINGLPARILLDGGSNTNMISPEFATVSKVTAVELQEQMTLQLAVTGSRSKINYGTWVPIEFGPVRTDIYFDIANIDGYDAILGTPFLWEHGISPIYEGDGWVMRNGKRIDFPSNSSTARNPGYSFRN